MKENHVKRNVRVIMNPYIKKDPSDYQYLIDNLINKEIERDGGRRLTFANLQKYSNIKNMVDLIRNMIDNGVYN